jgi:2-polyprenyl-3-methyl-5-hydroxy-6-metoxy-1,4-benzoquinol methylase
MRNIGVRRNDYQTNNPEEEFIVPILKNAIEELISNYSQMLKNEKVLDVGSGRQPFKEKLTLYGGEYFSVDVEQQFNTENDFEGAIDKELSSEIINAGPYNFILCTEVLEHVANWDKAFSNFKLLLKKGGILICTAPFIYMLHEEPYDYWRPTPHAFHHYCLKHNLIVKIENKSGEFNDVLGTVFGLTYFHTLQAKNKTFFNKTCAYILRKIFTLFFKLLKSRYLNKFQVHTELYLSNVMVISHK